MASSRSGRRWLGGLLAAAAGASALSLLSVANRDAPDALDAPGTPERAGVARSGRALPLIGAPPVPARSPGVPPSGAAVRDTADFPAPIPLTKKHLLEKAGEKDGDTTFTRLVEQALDAVPRLTDSERGELRAIARKRLAALKMALDEDPSTAADPASPDDDPLSAVERELLGPERYRDYRAALADLFVH